MAPKEGHKEISAGEDWQVECQELSTRLGQVLARGLWTDCKVSVGISQTIVRAHRVLLAAASPVFASMLFDSSTRYDDCPIVLPYTDSDTFDIILEFIYTDKINITSCDVARSLYKAARRLKLSKILSECKTYLTNFLCPSCAVSVYEFATEHKEYTLVDKCRKFICTETMTALEHIEDANADTVAKIFAMPHLVIDPELDLFQAAEHWLAEQHTPLATFKRGIVKLLSIMDKHIIKINNNNNVQEMDETTEQEEPENAIKKALQQIRFLLLDPDSFAAYETSSLLSESEMLAISFNLLSSKSHIPMPEGFSVSKEPRIAIFELTINNVNTDKNGKDEDDITSEECRIYDLPWKVEFKKCFRSAYVKCNWNHEPEKWACTADVSIKVISQKEGVSDLLVKEPYTHRYHGYGMLRGYYSYCFSLSADWNKLIDPENGYVEDDSITIEVRVAARPPVFNE